MDAPTAAPAAPTTPQQATEQRAALMRDPDWAAQAMDPASANWQQLMALDRVIAPPEDASEGRQEPLQGPQAPRVALEDGEDADGPPAGFYDPPASPSGYTLPTNQARQAGLQVDPAEDIALRQGFHAAGVDPHLANLLYTTAVNVAVRGMTEVDLASEHFNSEAALRLRWGTAYEANLAAANAEAKAIFQFLPASVTAGKTFAEFMHDTGLGNNRLVIEQLLVRARVRAKR